MDENPTTETGLHIDALNKQASGDGLPEQLFQLRRKLGQKAKQEPKFRFYTRYGRILWRTTLEAAWNRPERARPEILECNPLGKGVAEGTGEAATR